MCPNAMSSWGPTLDHYSRHFEPRVSEIARNTFTTYSGTEYEILTLEGMESTLGLSDPRRVEFEAAELPIDEALVMLQRYTTRLNRQPVFSNYWGFLCVRYIVHIVCLDLLDEMDLLNPLLARLPPNVSWVNFSEIIASAAIRATTEVVTASVLPQVLNRVFSRSEFTRFKGSIESDAAFLIRLLWEDRESLLVLSSQGHLHGCTLLFLAAWKWLPTSPEDQFVQYSLFLQDLCYRLYLVGSNSDRQVVHHICWYMIDQNLEWSHFTERFASTEDSQRISSAYDNLLLKAQTSEATMQVLSVDVMSFVGKYVLQMRISDMHNITIWDLITTTYQNIQFLWLFLQHRNTMDLVDGDKLKEHALSLFGIIAHTQTSLIRNPGDQYDFARMLAAADIVALVARVVLTIVDDEGGENEWKSIFGATFGLVQELDKSIRVAPDFFRESSIEWARFIDQLAAWIRTSDATATGRFSERFLQGNLYILKKWAHSKLMMDKSKHRKCSYPRCFRVVVNDKISTEVYQCSRCGTSMYCGPNCQIAHWLLPTSDSHRTGCCTSKQ